MEKVVELAAEEVEKVNSMKRNLDKTNTKCGN